jgi:hypothetical protein
MALPPTIQTIVGLIGHAKAMALVEALGGQDFRFPVRKQGDNWEVLVETVGPRAASALVDYFNGDEVYIALCNEALRADRNRRMIVRYDALLREGHSSRGAVSVLVQEFRPISNRTVEKIVNGPAPSAQPEMVTQGSLF